MQTFKGSLAKYRIYLKQLELLNLDPSVFQGPLIASFHSLEENGSDIKELLGVTPELPVIDHTAGYEYLKLESDILNFALVVHSTISGPVGYTRLEIDPALWSATLRATLSTDAPAFVQPQVSLTVSCSIRASIEYCTNYLFVDDGFRFGSVLPNCEPGKVKLEMRLVEGHKVIQSAVSECLTAKLLRDAYALVNEKLVIERYFSGTDFEVLKVELFVLQNSNTSLIDTIPLKSMSMNVPRFAGTDGQGQLMIRTTEDFSAASLCNQDLVSEFFLKKSLEKCSFRRYHVSLAGLSETSINGCIRYAIKGYGFSNHFDVSSYSSINITSGVVCLELSALSSHHAVPVLALVVSDAAMQTVGIYSIPLLSKTHSFDSLAIQVEKVTDENIDTIFLPPISHFPKFNDPLTNKTVRLYCSVESLSTFPCELESVFVTFRSVKMTVCPLMVPPRDVLSLQCDDDLTATTLSASTVSRSRTCRPVWQHDLQIDIFQWNANDWLYFLVYNEVDCGTRMVGQACLSQSLLSSETRNESFTLPVFDGNTFKGIPECFLIVSFNKSVDSWAPIYVSQRSSAQSCPHPGELRLTVNILKDTECTEVLKNNHIWLPIKKVYPLIIWNSPPRGNLTLSLSRLNGTVFAESFHKYSCLDTVLSCGGFDFNFSRNA